MRRLGARPANRGMHWSSRRISLIAPLSATTIIPCFRLRMTRCLLAVHLPLHPDRLSSWLDKLTNKSVFGLWSPLSAPRPLSSRTCLTLTLSPGVGHVIFGFRPPPTSGTLIYIVRQTCRQHVLAKLSRICRVVAFHTLFPLRRGPFASSSNSGLALPSAPSPRASY